MEGTKLHHDGYLLKEYCNSFLDFSWETLYSDTFHMDVENVSSSKIYYENLSCA